ncbi:prepilin-type N-terminal cleavage/methylation domain-containing protein [Pseudoalteromonas sp. NEC-BIFX-2020_015]|uniref:pilin n=1 Tax=Pseudoalteromonas sp. NEC-BIFX-2020_015 TaxID=2729544 RepID=UPI0014615BDE|nr:prepilin-type N-terminal cleavage/methylation domain-containing protein [Pseudoalteromonas sp. NEC-BIFX-2020_015]NMR27995.1 prepilin-type N-terminal cleavage/methylation domain-containing protein [Pseudoalteromonas sp. NEC-BIFX-2020_015]
MRNKLGFSLIELMITIAIMGILVSLALPAYNNHYKRAKFTEVTLATNSLQRAVEICFYTKETLSNCDSFSKIGVKKPNYLAPNFIANIEISYAAGSYKITSTASSEASISSGDTYIMIATINSNQLLWELSPTSTCISEGTC